jgi:hypothetical protein
MAGRLLTAYVTYYHGARTHFALKKDAPTTRHVQTPTEGHVVAFPEIGGLHHRYERPAARPASLTVDSILDVRLRVCAERPCVGVGVV